MVNIHVRTMGQDLSQLDKDVRRKTNQRMFGALTASVNEWRKLVITSTWFSPVPSPTSLILAQWRKVGEGFLFTYGWINYAGDPARADWRLSLRDWMFAPKLQARVDAIMQSAFGPVGGADPASGSGGQS